MSITTNTTIIPMTSSASITTTTYPVTSSASITSTTTTIPATTTIASTGTFFHFCNSLGWFHLQYVAISKVNICIQHLHLTFTRKIGNAPFYYSQVALTRIILALVLHNKMSSPMFAHCVVVLNNG